MSSERREREKRELKQAILATAREIAVNEGWEAVTIRKIACAIEYGPPAIYAIFENKEAILTELIRDGFQRLLEVVHQSYNEEAEPAARLLALGHAYWDFAQRCPKLYKVMHGLDGVPFNAENKPQEIKELNAFAGKCLREALSNPDISPAKVDDMVQIMRATFQGLVAVTMSGRIEGGPARAKALMEIALNDLLYSWKHGRVWV